MNPTDSIENQRLAADPGASAWVSASAGTGKTTVLVGRLLRLFLSGADPGKVLCLTYTNAGAIEMQSRVLSKVRSWAAMDGRKLAEELRRLGSDAPPDTARGLFPKLADSAAPLKIHTIHAFCQSMLKRFPIEAGAPPRFSILDENEAENMLAQAWRAVVKKARNKEDEELSRAMAYIVENASENEFEDIRSELVSSREKWRDAAPESLIARIFPYPVQADMIENPDLARAKAVSRIPEDWISHFIGASAESSPSMKKQGEALLAFLSLETEGERAARFDDYAGIFLTSEGEARKNLVVKELREKHPKMAEAMDAEAERVRLASDMLARAGIYNMTRALMSVGREIQREYAAQKDETGALDFDDLIIKTGELFSKPGISPWILYKTDGGISHILVDEAQDTSDAQWRIIDALSENFFAPGGDKTLFVVGDKKQSIYGFQGADAAKFAQYKELFSRRATEAGYRFLDLPLDLSFRSAKNILALVDKSFEGIWDDKTQHFAWRADYDGYVEIVPLVKPFEDEEKNMLKPPVEAAKARNSQYDLASILAQKIRGLIESGYAPRDIMVLVQRRANARPVEAKLREAKIPVSGAQRENIGDNIAVADLISLAKFTQYPYDDLSLCEALKSPIFDMDDDDLTRLCYGRGERSVLDMADGGLKRELETLIKDSGTMSPFRFFSGIISRHRRRFISRLGRGAADALDSLVDAALLYDRAKVGKSMAGFLEWFESI
ncbi:MAG: UvrD-helicase domain-containing protein, partial [Rickettsiales bacterium]|nr:UvrD-helicase domain-containing protein [Rickettsiales bacterium]